MKDELKSELIYVLCRKLLFKFSSNLDILRPEYEKMVFATVSDCRRL